MFFRAIVGPPRTSGYLFGSESIRPKRHLRYPPVMITRLMLSLKKAATSQEHEWGLGELTARTAMGFADRRGGVSTSDEICLDTFASTREGTQSRQD
jgi:hypothetical protein